MKTNYKEKVIGGVLFYKTQHDEHWQPFTSEQYTNIIVELRKQLQAMRDNPNIRKHYEQVRKEIRE